MKLKPLLRLGCVLLMAIALLNCRRSEREPEQPSPVTVSHPRMESVTAYLDLTGTVAASLSVDLVARVSGYLQSVNFADGSFVDKGQLLFVIDPKPYEEQLKLNQAALLRAKSEYTWLRAPDPNHRKNVFFRWFNSVYELLEHFYTRLIRRMVQHSGLTVLIALVLVSLAAWGLTRVPTGFIPTEDQGYLMVSVQLPDGASLQRTGKVMDEISGIGRSIPGVKRAIVIGGISPLDNNASLANAGIIYFMLKDWSLRGRGEDLRTIYLTLSKKLEAFQGAGTLVLVPPPIQGLGLSGGFQMQVELTDGSYDFVRLQQAADAIVAAARKDVMVRAAFTPFRAQVPQVAVTVNRAQAETLNVPVGDVYETLQTYLGSSYVNLFTKFGHNFMVFAQAEPKKRVTADDLKHYYVRSRNGQMVPLGTLAAIESTVGPAVITLYNLFPSATINGAAAAGFSSGQVLTAIRSIAGRILGPGMQFQWTAMSYQEKLVGNAAYFIFGMAILLVYLVLAGQYESWFIPVAVIFAVPLALLGTVAAMLGIGFANNIYVQIGLVLLIALAAKNAILIVEMARERRASGNSIAEAAVEAARVRFRPILMTSFTFIFGVLPLVFASGAGASARKSLGIAVVSGMLSSTCLAVLFVPSFFVVLQKFTERKKAKKPI